MRPQLALAAGLLASALASRAAAQDVQVLPARGPAPTLDDLPPLPALTALSPRNTMLYADRVRVGQGAAPQGMVPASSPLVDAVLPTSVTGTSKPEGIQYALPQSPAGPVPLLVAWHGFGSSAATVSDQTTLDEECDARGWAYLAVTGIDDKLFGPPLAQQNVAAAIAWMHTQIELDDSRLYMVGFSAGGGCVANFAARHRDPDGPVVAALGTVSASMDWTQTWWLEPATRTWLQNPFNFGGPPSFSLFAYQRSSTLYFDPDTYPPAPGTALDSFAMAQNLHATPAWITWDTGDTIGYLPKQSVHLAALLGSYGDTVQAVPVSGTTDPDTGLPATHSWAVLDETALCDFLAAHVAQPLPGAVTALVDDERDVAWMHVEPRDPQAFAWVRGEADPSGTAVAVHDVKGADRVLVAPAAPGPWDISAGAADAAGFQTGVFDAAPAAGYALNKQGHVVPGFEYEPAGAGLLLAVTKSVSFHVQPRTWDATLAVAPDPALTGSPVAVKIDAAMGAKMAWLVAGVGLDELPFGSGHLLLVEPVPPFVLMPVPLDASGNVKLQSTIPGNGKLSGAWVFLQAIVQGPGAVISGASNPFRFDVQ
ncbi:MAG TPA: hypothetical protein VFY71_08615 [Planctomycetota bacterium]|nr:hypothetical protein [Planctomycetota bacterium]